MSPTVAQVFAWNPGALTSTAEGIEGLRAQLDERTDDLASGQNTLLETWHGSAADAAASRVERERATAGLVAHALGQVARAYRDGAASIGSVREHLTSLVRGIRLRGFKVGDDGVVDASGLLGWLVIAPPESRDAVRLELEKEAAEMTLAVVDALRQADSAASDVVGRIRESLSAVTSAGQAAAPGRMVESEAGEFSWKPDIAATAAASTIGVMLDATERGLAGAVASSGDDVGRLIVRGMGPLGAVVGAVPAIANDINGGMDATKAVTTEMAGAGAGLALGTLAGGAVSGVVSSALAGSAAGSVVPGLGTAAGLVVGAVVGGFSAWGGSKFLQWAWD